MPSPSGPVLISGASVVDGTGAAAFAADVVIDRGVISAVAPAGSVPTDRVGRRLDAGGHVLAPGFIDVHSHADNAPLLDADDETKILQGVTTEVVGNCGTSLAPVAPGGEQDFLRATAAFFPEAYRGWHTTAELYAALDERGYVTNHCPLVGHGELRLATIGPVGRAADRRDVLAMGSLLREAVEAGAFGMSTGLIYPPGIYADTEELASVAAHLPPDRVYATHMRNESTGLLDSIAESLAVGRAAGCRVEVSHLKAGGRTSWGMVEPALELLDAARAAGLPVTQDVYPYDAASTVLGACLPPWVHDGGRQAALRRLRDEEALRRMRDQIEAPGAGAWDNILEGTGGYHGVLVSSTASGRREGATLAQIAAAEHLDPFDAMVLVLLEEEMSATMVEFCMTEADIETVLRSSTTMIGSDGLPPGLAGRPHPRLHGTFPRVLGRYSRERGVLGVEEAVRRMTSVPAEVFGIPGRGRIAVGMVADLVCFDPETVGHPGTYAEPDLPPTGIDWVMQAGHPVVDGGRWLGVRRGERLTPR